MPRANRYHTSGYIWHITDRCHNRSFLLKFQKDRYCFEQWLAEAKRRYGFSLLNYIVTSNHVHLLVYDHGKPEVIEKSMQLIAGQVAQQYNRRKGRSGAFWEGRYHATAVQSGRHLRRCMRYIDLNMVRTGKVAHPSEWIHSGFCRIQDPLEKENLLDTEQAIQCLGLTCLKELQSWQYSAIEEALQKPIFREPQWTESIAIGDPDFLHRIAKALSLPRHKHSAEGFRLNEPKGAYL